MAISMSGAVRALFPTEQEYSVLLLAAQERAELEEIDERVGFFNREAREIGERMYFWWRIACLIQDRPIFVLAGALSAGLIGFNLIAGLFAR